jgi:hypothetical protein
MASIDRKPGENDRGCYLPHIRQAAKLQTDFWEAQVRRLARYNSPPGPPILPLRHS